MTHSFRPTFEETLLAVASQNVQSLEHKAHTASSLAVTYPKNAGVFRAIESEAIQQMFHVLVQMPSMPSARTVAGERPSAEIAEAKPVAD